MIVGLGYLVLNTNQMQAWKDFSKKVLGIEVSLNETTQLHGVKLDSQSYRIAFQDSANEEIGAIGWQVANYQSFANVLEFLSREGIPFEHITGEAAQQQRDVLELVRLKDPSGIPTEIFVGPRVEDEVVVSNFGQKFVVGDQGLGHIFLAPPNQFDACYRFYESLGFLLSNVIHRGAERFYHCGPRQHALGLADVSKYPGEVRFFDHLMIEVDHIDGVGIAHEACLNGAAEITYTLGRHGNDGIFSFYCLTPGGFNIEIGYAGIDAKHIDPRNCFLTEHTNDSIWGHRSTKVKG